MGRAYAVMQRQPLYAVGENSDLVNRVGRRIATECLRRLGVAVEEREDSMSIQGGGRFKGGEIRSYADHRIAMAFAIAGLCSEVGIAIDDAACIDISFPSFFDLLRKICLH